VVRLTLETYYFTITDQNGYKDIVGVETDKDKVQTFLYLKQLYNDYDVEYFLSSQ